MPVLGIITFVPAFFAGAGIPVFSFITPLPQSAVLRRPSGRRLGTCRHPLPTCTRCAPNRIVGTCRIFIDQSPDTSAETVPEPAAKRCCLLRLP